MDSNFQTALGRSLRHEGGWSDHPADPGGATYKGVTQRVYDAWRKERGLTKRSVRQMDQRELEAIYRAQYWLKAGCDKLPSGIDYAVFDYAVNSGVQKAVKDLQRAAGMTGKAVDGIMGLNTLAAVERCKASTLINAICDKRLAFLKGLKHWKTFGRGWTSRVAEVRAGALAMAGSKPIPAEAVFVPKPEAARAPVTQRKERAWLSKLAKDPLAAIPVVGGALASLADVPEPIQYAIAATIIGGAIWFAVRALKRDPVT